MRSSENQDAVFIAFLVGIFVGKFVSPPTAQSLHIWPLFLIPAILILGVLYDAFTSATNNADGTPTTLRSRAVNFARSTAELGLFIMVWLGYVAALAAVVGVIALV